MFKQIWDTNLTEAYDKPLENPGQIRFGENGKIYRWVKNGTGETVAAGSVVFYGTNDLTLNEVYKLNQSAKGTAQALMAGVTMSTLQPAGTNKKSYGWIQTYGVNEATLALSTSTALATGVTCIGVNDQYHVTHGQAVGTAPAYPVNITALQALATTVTVATTIKAFINCR